MKTEDKKQIKDLIDALQMLGFKRKDDKEFLPIFIDRAVCNPFKLSYITKYKFEALEKTEALEVYWSELNHNDIVRKGVGGLINYL